MGIASLYRVKSPLNVIVITLDTTRADRLGCYGYDAAVTPTIDALAKRGVVFERAYTPVPLTLPAHASMFTGLFSFEHGLYTNGSHGLPNEIPTLAEALAARGYATGAFIASFALHRVFGVDRGFDVYDDDVDGPSTVEPPGGRKRSADQVVDRSLAWLSQRNHKPFFCWVHLFDPHAEYLEHRETFGDKFRGRPYDAEIAYVDLHLKRLFDYLDAQRLTERTMVVIVGDHGEGLTEHRERWHGYMLYNSTLRVPLIVSVPSRVQSHRRISDPVSLIDLAPTVLDCLDLPGLSPVSGRSLKPAIQGEPLPAKACYGVAKEVFLEDGWSPLSCVITADWKYIQTTRPELYDLRNDPGEEVNLAETQSEMMLALQQQLVELEASGVRYKTRSVSLSERDRSNLAGLGYLGTSNSQNKSRDALPDIKDNLDDFDAYQGALEQFISGQSESAVAPLYQLTVAAPRYLAPRLLLAQILSSKGKVDEAEGQYLAVLDIDSGNMDAHTNLGKLLATQKQYERALVHLQTALKSGPLSVDLHLTIGKILKAMGRSPEAVNYFQKAEELAMRQRMRRPAKKP
jgi:arylsulfatase A-like enzyme/predicted negative regulator of RcsB-dependent stress response